MAAGHLSHCVLTLSGAAQNLGTLVAAAGISVPANCTVLNLQIQPLAANTGVVYLGGVGSAAISSTNYGVRLEIPASSIPQAPYMVPGGDRSGPAITLEDVSIISAVASDKVSVFFQRSDV